MGLTYAIGDLHGRYDLLHAALDWIDSDAIRNRCDKIVTLGDYIDRGPESARIIERLIAEQLASSHKFVCLLGNHEEMLLNAIKGRDDLLEHWLANGGKQTLESYGGSILRSHIEWIESLPLIHEDEHRIFVHAGLNPKRTIADQTEYDMLWIRDRFLNASHDFGKHVVHGHTPQDGKPDLRSYRSNLDVGSVWTGKICVAVFDPLIAGGPIWTEILGG